ncbi:aspartate dehydrogenase [Stappia sp. 22II-S9-Z10]|nr:aspartate dehydrogenase [Stappia sp. 22II-S9-Z10]
MTAIAEETASAAGGKHVAVIGFGAMGRAVTTSLAARGGPALIRTALLRQGSAAPLPDDVTRVTSVDDLIAARPDLVVEGATHEAVATSVPALLAAGIDVVIASVGALGKPEIHAAVIQAAARGGSRAIVATGAIGGLDALRSAACAGLSSVLYTGIKPAAAWTGTPAEEVLDLGALTAPATFFEGTAREAAERFPKNANVTAAVALAGVGFDATRVRLVADVAGGNRHEVSAQGPFGSFHIALTNAPLPANPKTSWLAALSVEQAILRQFQHLEA